MVLLVNENRSLNLMPPSEEYAPIVRGPLKLKGSGPSGIQKKKKKKKKPINHDQGSPNHNENSSGPLVKSKALAGGVEDKIHLEDDSISSTLSKKDAPQQDDKSNDQDLTSGKTASERSFEEMRKKRLMDRLAKEGLKSHKQRVEELNKYLSNLSEHHDMPRIGPG